MLKTWTPSGGFTEETYYVYDTAGNLAAEYSTDPNPATGTAYLFSDMLGSVRAITDQTGNVTECYDYLPFGRMLSAGDNGRGSVGCHPPNPDTALDSDVSQKFTGQVRDGETRIDYFETRYLSSPEGRFLSADALLAKDEWLPDPQRWNKYAYVRNNPLRYVDPNGEDLTIVLDSSGLDEELLKWFLANKESILEQIRSKLNDAGVSKVHFVERDTLTDSQLARLGQLPIEDKRPETFVHGLVQLSFRDRTSGIVTRGSPVTNGFGFANSGRAEVFLGNIKNRGCGRACASSNVTAHEIGHTIGLTDRGHYFGVSVSEWFRTMVGRPRDVMYSGDPYHAPYGYNTDDERNQRILEELDKIRPIY